MAKIMMSKKTKRLYGRMQHGIQKKQEAVDRLEEKRKEIESSGSSVAEPVKKKQKKGAAAVEEPSKLAKATTPQKNVKSKVDQKAKAKEVPSPVSAKKNAPVSAEKRTKRKR